MFVSTPLIFTELHKTAGSHIGKLLSQYIDGKQVGKHNRIPADYRDRFVLGSIRNPWDWYVSLWGYGCDGRGSVFYQTTKRNKLLYANQNIASEMGRKSLSPTQLVKQWRHERCKPIEMWQDVYRDVSDIHNFRQWIRLIFAPERRMDIGEGYFYSPISNTNGLLTYRFFKLFTSLDNQLYDDSFDTSLMGLNKSWEDTGFIDAFIRQEELESDFIAALKKANVELTEQQIIEIKEARNNKTNTSSRKNASHYYDEETANLVRKHEQFIINKFDYTFQKS